VTFAYQQVGGTASVNCLKAVCVAMMNRLRAQWSNDLLELIEQAPQCAAHDPIDVTVTLKSPALLGLLRDIDDLYYGSVEDDTRKIIAPPPPRKPMLYWQNLLVKQTRPWFVENIIRRADEHPRMAQVGMIVFYE
jgi:hypothetical protein